MMWLLNFFGAAPRDVTHYGQRVEDFVADRIVAELSGDVGYEARRQAVDAFNAAKAGTLTPEQQAQVDALDAALNERVVMVPAAFAGGTVTVMVNVLVVRSTPPLAVPPLISEKVNVSAVGTPATK